ncbi:MAG TPA: 5-formyltetrahydrofolate cyclo-ligase [Blastocatellia bacterium]|jgi:5-formyltetrahydrofolate cyclo-ligase|nr:5-formyltetrahydrofolate cyclo-ligase [Blastocatellia bacterium]
MTKQEIRERVWQLMEARKVSRFPGAKGRIPHFKGAEQCARHLSELNAWKRAKVIKSNPDSPQRALRHLALKEGKTIYMAVPRLREKKCFIELEPKRLGKRLYEASSIKGAFELGRQVEVDEMQPVDLILCGSVAVRRDGARVGKGGGYSDLEYGIARELRIVGPRTPIITSVHALQIVDDEIELKPHDIPVDFIITPDEVIATATKLLRPRGVYWDYLDEEKLDSIPLLRDAAKSRSLKPKSAKAK